MTNLYYYDAGGKKTGPVTPAQLQALAQQGRITPETTIADDKGQTTLAKNLKGIAFVTAPAGPNPFIAPMPPIDQTAIPAGTKRTSIFAALGNMGSCFTLIVCWIILIGVLGTAAWALFPEHVNDWSEKLKSFILERSDYSPNDTGTKITSGTPIQTTQEQTIIDNAAAMEKIILEQAAEMKRIAIAQTAAKQAANDAAAAAKNVTNTVTGAERDANAAEQAAKGAAGQPVETAGGRAVSH